MNNCVILFGLLFNLVGVIFLFYGLRTAKNAGMHETSIPNGTFIRNLYVMEKKPLILHCGLFLMCLGIVFQMIGTLMR